METKQYVHLEVTKGDHTFTFKMPLGSTWGQAVDAAFEIATHVSRLATDVIERSIPVAKESDNATINQGE